MLAMMSVIVEKCVFICFLTFYILQAVAPKCRLAQGNPPTLPHDGPGCINKALINVLKKLTQCINA